MDRLEAAIDGLAQVLRAPPDEGWGWLIRQRMSAVRSALTTEPDWATDGWLAARGGCVLRARARLLTELGDVGRQALAVARFDDIRDPLHRLLGDLEHHRRLICDLVYDSVELELGGSE